MGAFLVLPTRSDTTYWWNYWDAKRTEMGEYSKTPCKAKWKKGEAHTFGTKKVPDEGAIKWVGSY